ncbi:MAG: hypothetical protein RL217_687 [Pseudomonadota bacterium]|jgi:hypothetical protein
MTSLSTIEVLLLGNMAVLVLFVALLWRMHRVHKNEARRLDAALSVMHKAQSALSNSTLGMGRRIKQLDSKVQGAQRTSAVADDDAAFLQASRMASLGSSVADLVEKCGLPRAEAELMVSMHRKHWVAN